MRPIEIAELGRHRLVPPGDMHQECSYHDRVVLGIRFGVHASVRRIHQHVVELVRCPGGQCCGRAGAAGVRLPIPPIRYEAALIRLPRRESTTTRPRSSQSFSVAVTAAIMLVRPVPSANRLFTSRQNSSASA